MIRKIDGGNSGTVMFIIGGEREVVAPVRFRVLHDIQTGEYRIWDEYEACWVNPGYAKVAEALQPVADMLNLMEVEPITS